MQKNFYNIMFLIGCLFMAIAIAMTFISLGLSGTLLPPMTGNNVPLLVAIPYCIGIIAWLSDAVWWVIDTFRRWKQ